MIDVVVGLLIVGPALFTFILKSNGALAFLAVCAGYVAATLSGNEVSDLLSNTDFKIRNTDINLLYLFLPMAFTIFLTTKAVSTKLKVYLHTLAAALAGALLVIAAAPFMSISLHMNMGDSAIWKVLSSAQSFIAAGGALYCLLLVWFFSSKHNSKKHK
jgi:hypothetical protein